MPGERRESRRRPGNPSFQLWSVTPWFPSTAGGALGSAAPGDRDLSGGGRVMREENTRISKLSSYLLRHRPARVPPRFIDGCVEVELTPPERLRGR